MSEFEGAVALVTGAAGGIGAAVVERLAGCGARVAAVDLSPVDLTPVDLAADGRVAPGGDHAAERVRRYATDVRVTEQVEATVADVEADLGPITHLVNAAGVLSEATALETTDEQWTRTLEVNVGGVFRVSRAVCARMAARGRGAVVTVASNAATVPRVGMAAYSASKAAAVAVTKVMGLELAASGVRCNVVGPGSTDTAMLRSLWTDEHGPSHSLDGDLAAYRVGIPLGRIATPRHIADAVVFLLSEQASHITMHDLHVDGGAGLGA